MKLYFLFFTMASAAPMIPLERFQAMLATEVTHEFPSSHSTHSRYLQQDSWDAALQHEFHVVAEREALEHTPSPFLVCDFTYGKTGDLCQANIAAQLGTDDLLPVINKVDQTCFIVQALPSVIAELTSLAAIPLTAEMRIQQNLVDHIEQGQIQRIDATFCLGQAQTEEQAHDLATRVLLERVNHRHLSAFLEGRVHRSEERELFWRRRLEEDIDMTLCEDIHSEMELDITMSSMSLEFTEKHTQYPECLHALVVHLAQQPEICFVGGYQQIELLNDEASGIVQDGENKNKLFHQKGLNGTGQVVAMSDTGVDVDNCYFYDPNISVEKSKSLRFDSSARKIVQYYTFSDGYDEPSGHGTHVAATIVGHRNDGKIGRADAIAKGAKLAVFDMQGTQGMRRPNVLEMFEPGYGAGARIHSASWGIPNENRYSGYDRDIDRYLYNHPDLLFVVAAGNSGRGNIRNTVASPAITKNGISVGATDSSVGGILADFSSRGPTADGRIKPDVVAPGVMITSARADPFSRGECDESSGLVQMSGTSMATPLVAGVAAIVRQYFAEGWYQDGTKNEVIGYQPRASLVKAVILNGAGELRGISGSYPTEPYDIHQGFGRVNMKSSLPLGGKNAMKAVFINAQSISSDEEITYNVKIDDSFTCSGPLSATLVWTDPAGAPFCNKGCLLNDLDLFLTRKDREGTIFPNNLNQADTTNNAERVRIENPLPGDTYTIHVKGTDLLVSQEYSLVITGCFIDDSMTNDAADEELAEKEDADCEDGLGLISINDNTIKDCKWLSTNMDDFDFLCSYTDIVSECPSTCNRCTFKGLEAGRGFVKAYLGSSTSPLRWYGTTFDLQTSTSLTFQGLSLHLSSNEAYRVQVLISRGDRASVGNSLVADWTSVCDTIVKGAGANKAIQIEGPEHCRPFHMNENSSFTIQVDVESKRPGLILSKHNGGVDQVVLVNQHMVVRSGVTAFSDNEHPVDGYTLNGSVLYALSDNDNCVDSSGDVEIQGVGAKNCAWLQLNLHRFGHLCDRTEVASHCPMTCRVCTEEK